MSADLGDQWNQLPNVNALIEAYQNGTLRSWPRLVTYWSRGRQLSQPRPFDWDEFEAINYDHNGEEGFWVEGVRCHHHLLTPYFILHEVTAIA